MEYLFTIAHAYAYRYSQKLPLGGEKKTIKRNAFILSILGGIGLLGAVVLALAPCFGKKAGPYIAVHNRHRYVIFGTWLFIRRFLKMEFAGSTR